MAFSSVFQLVGVCCSSPPLGGHVGVVLVLAGALRRFLPFSFGLVAPLL